MAGTELVRRDLDRISTLRGAARSGRRRAWNQADSCGDAQYRAGFRRPRRSRSSARSTRPKLSGEARMTLEISTAIWALPSLAKGSLIRAESFSASSAIRREN
jgi:hypothetical protein